MKTLIDIAQNIGLQPGVDLTGHNWFHIQSKISARLTRTIEPSSPGDSRSVSLTGHTGDLITCLNILYNRLPHNWSHDVINQAEELMLGNKGAGHFVWVHTQNRPYPNSESYVWHSSWQHQPMCEQFLANIDLASPYLGQMINHLDYFINKAYGSFRLATDKTTRQCDVLRLYLPQAITAETASRFHQIVRPCLIEQHHDYLNGLDIYADGNPVRGIKIAPEIQPLSDGINPPPARRPFKEFLNTLTEQPHLQLIAEHIGTRFFHTSSLAEHCAAQKVMDLFCYLIGREGSNPLSLYDTNGNPYNKHLVFTPLPDPLPPARIVQHPMRMPASADRVATKA